MYLNERVFRPYGYELQQVVDMNPVVPMEPEPVLEEDNQSELDFNRLLEERYPVVKRYMDMQTFAQQGAKKRKQEEEIVAETEQCEERIQQDLGRLIENVNKRPRVCNLGQLQDFAAELSCRSRLVKELHTHGADRRCQ